MKSMKAVHMKPKYTSCEKPFVLIVASAARTPVVTAAHHIRQHAMMSAALDQR